MGRLRLCDWLAADPRSRPARGMDGRRPGPVHAADEPRDPPLVQQRDGGHRARPPRRLASLPLVGGGHGHHALRRLCGRDPDRRRRLGCKLRPGEAGHHRGDGPRK